MLSDETGSLQKQNFDDDTYETHSEESDSLSEGPEHTDDEEQTLQTYETYGTHSVGSIVDTASLESARQKHSMKGSRSLKRQSGRQHLTTTGRLHSIAIGRKHSTIVLGRKQLNERMNTAQEATFLMRLSREMTVVGTASSTDSSDEESSSESDESSMSSISNASGFSDD